MAQQTQTHARNITINIALAALAAAQQGFGSTLFLVPTANTLNGETVVTLNSSDDGQDLVTAGEMVANTFLGVQAFFNQQPSGSSLKVAALTAPDAGNYATALARVRAVDDTFYGVTLEPRTSTEILQLSAAVESLNKLLIFQSADADWLTAGLPAGFTGVETRERTIAVYHDTATQFADLAYASNRLAADPDIASAPWDAPISGVSQYSSVLNATQVTNLSANNINFGLPHGGEPFFVDPGHNTKGRAIHELVTSDWFEARLLERVASTKVDLSKRFEKWPMNEAGQNLLLNIALGLIGEGEIAGHFEPGTAALETPAITESDENAERLRLTGSVQFLNSARLFNFDINMSR